MADKVDTTRAEEIAIATNFQSQIIRDVFTAKKLADNINLYIPIYDTINAILDSTYYEDITRVIENDSIIESIVLDTLDGIGTIDSSTFYDTITVLDTVPWIDTIEFYTYEIDTIIDTLYYYMDTVTNSNNQILYTIEINDSNAFRSISYSNLLANNDLQQFHISISDHSTSLLDLDIDLESYCFSETCLINELNFNIIGASSADFNLNFSPNMLSNADTILCNFDGSLALNTTLDDQISNFSFKQIGKLLIQDYNATIITPLIINYSGCSQLKQGIIEYDGEGEIETKAVDFKKTTCEFKMIMQVGRKKYNAYYNQ